VDALADVSFEVRRGEFVAVPGPSAAGKTPRRVVEDAPVAGVGAGAVEQIHDRSGHRAGGSGA
jgi:ABC-type phosphate/phosphonate transport system ATPase subunit